MRFVLLGKGRPAEIAYRTLHDAGQEIITSARHDDDLIIETIYDAGLCIGYEHLLDDYTIKRAWKGWFNIHSSLLPAYKGRAPLNWAILNGETMLGATLHVIDETVDGGDIIEQQSFLLGEDEDVGDAVAMLEAIYVRLIRLLVDGLEGGELLRRPMGKGDGIIWPARTDADGEIDWNAPATEILNLIRATAPPYPGAWVRIGDRKLRILKARLDAA